mmetsp:Transcript_16564/g.42051  ORF Transcript_16564/g.42051 Transcript_16564/m.42051 type:complete len:149 (+) Transcript_16564:123-569(+)|eukprot:jgi/Tetstr1/427657/TSEL_017782.t1
MSSTTSSQRGAANKVNVIDAEMKMKSIAGGLTGALENFHMRQREVEGELKVDAEGLAEVENELYKLNKRRKFLEDRIKTGKDWLENYETNIAPIAGQYDKMVAGMGEIYQTAVDGHTKGIELLKKDFGYHPAYKRHDDKFTATPFKPL